MKSIFKLILFVIIISTFTCMIDAQENLTIPITADTYTESIFFDEPHGTSRYLLLGYGNSAREGITRIFLKHDSSSLLSLSSSDISKATLHLYQERVNSLLDYSVEIYKADEFWEENTLTEMNSHIVQLRNPFSISISKQLGWINIDVTEIVKSELSSRNFNGIILKMSDEMAAGGRFWARECFTALEPPFCPTNLAPYLELELAPIVVDDNPPVIEEKIDLNPVKKEIIHEITEAENKIVKELQGIKSSNSDIGTKSDEEVKGISNIFTQKSTCKYSFNIASKRISNPTCNLAIPIIQSVIQKTNDTWNSYIEASLAIPTELHLLQRNTICKKKGILDIRTLIACIEVTKNISEKDLTDPIISVFAKIDNNIYQGFQTWSNNLLKLTIPLTTNANGKKISFFYTLSYSEKLSKNIWLDIYTKSKSNSSVLLNSIKTVNATYQLPFSKLFNVTQWHGNTSYQKPHTGIDFAVTIQPVYAISDGIIEYAGWDSHSGECLSGGNYILLRHNDGKYSTYLHLKSFEKSIRKGKTVKKGALLGISGNTGAYNCESLSYHMHFEIRRTKFQKDHINPVPYLNTDWNNILTADYKRYPGRLSGDNPHPSF